MIVLDYRDKRPIYEQVVEKLEKLIIGGGLEANSKLCNVPLNGIYNIVKCRMLVCAVLRNGTAIMPDGRFVLQAEDKLFIIATRKDLSLLLKNIGIVTHRVRRVILAGGGSIAYYLADALEDDRMKVTVIEQNRERCLKLAELLPNVNIIHGNASNRDLLESEGLADCDALVTLTGMDEQNVIISMYGSSCGVPQIITKLDRVDDAKILDSLPVGSIICPKKLNCNTIVRYVRAMRTGNGGAITIHSIADGQAEALEFLVDEATPHCETPLKELRLKKNILTAAECFRFPGAPIILPLLSAFAARRWTFSSVIIRGIITLEKITKS